MRYYVTSKGNVVGTMKGLVEMKNGKRDHPENYENSRFRPLQTSFPPQ